MKIRQLNSFLTTTVLIGFIRMTQPAP